MLVAMLTVLPCGAQERSDTRSVLWGICYSPFRTNQNPDHGVYPTKGEIQEDLEFIKRSGLTNRVRTYGSTGGVEVIPQLCNDLGLECWPGAWLGRYPGPNQREVQSLIKIGKMRLPKCPVLIVGNEVLLRKDLTEDELIETIQRVKQATGLPVAYAEIGDIWLRHPRVVESVDVCLVHLYPFWEGRPIEEAMIAFLASWNQLKKAYPDKRLVIGETGWQSTGITQGRAIPSSANHARYLKEFLGVTKTHGIDYFYFDMFDELWKGERDSYWGIFTADGKLKDGLEPIMPDSARRGMTRHPGKVSGPIPLELPAFVYLDGDSDQNRFMPTNHMGDTETLSLDELCRDAPHSGSSCIRVRFSPRHQVNWAGVYWVGPYFNHWGDHPGYTLQGAKRLVFWARGAKGNEAVQFKIGGMATPGKPFSDSFGPVPDGEPWVGLSREWRQFTIDLAGLTTTSLLGGFCFTTNGIYNPDGCEFFLDDIAIVADTVPNVPGPAIVAAPVVRPGDINAIPRAIREAQRKYVRESWGEQEAQCFTDADYAEFQRQGFPKKIAAEVLGKPDVQAAVLTLRMMPDTERRRLANSWRKPARPTWAQLRRVSREGQTDAGQRAEKDIANAIVDAVLGQCVLPAPPRDQGLVPGWGIFCNADGDCGARFQNGKLTLLVPGKPHDLSAEIGRMNAPRVLRDVEGDFVAEVKVSGTFRPGEPAIPGRLAYHGAGLLAMKDDQTYVRLERATSARGTDTFVYTSFECRESGVVERFASSADHPLDEAKETSLRLERRGNKVYATVSQDGQNWIPLEPKTVALPAKLRVGVAAVNSSTSDFRPQFEAWRLSRNGEHNSREP